MKTPHAIAFRDMTPEQQRARKNAQNLANYHRRMADPAFREAKAKKERERWANGDGERRNAINRDKNAKFKAIRETVPKTPKKPKVPREATPERVAQKREWRRAHAAELNARRAADRLANPAKYRAREKDFKRRRKEALTSVAKGPTVNEV